MESSDASDLQSSEPGEVLVVDESAPDELEPIRFYERPALQRAFVVGLVLVLLLLIGLVFPPSYFRF